MTKLQALKKSIAHWKRMIKWASRQEPTGGACAFKISEAIKEDWGDKYCALCAMFHTGIGQCIDCPVTPACNSLCSTWRTVAESNTWGEWVTAARFMLRDLERYYREEKVSDKRRSTKRKH